MSERERWIVYPLLFLTMGIALRDKVIQPISDEVRCRRLAVYDENDRKVAELAPMAVTLPGTGEQAHAGTLRLMDPFDYEGLNVTGNLDIFGPVNRPIVHIGASSSGGIVQVFHGRSDWSIALGQWETFSGLLSQALGSQFQQVLVDARDPLESVREELILDGLPPEPEEPAQERTAGGR
jgi:hypothetical protein